MKKVKGRFRPFRAILSAQVGDLFDVMHQAVEQPLHADFLQSAVGEAVESLVAAQVGKDRLHDGQPVRIDAACLRSVDLLAHPGSQRGGLCTDGNRKQFACSAPGDTASLQGAGRTVAGL